MKKIRKSLMLVGLSLLLGACGTKPQPSDSSNGDNTSITTYYTIAFNVNDKRYATARVKEGEKITQKITDPAPEDGYKFSGWYEEGTEELLDFETYVVMHDATFNAKFSKIEEGGEVLSVEDEKEEGKEYYLVLGWWECTTINDDGTQKLTSYLTKTDVRLIYRNIRKFLLATGSTEEDLANVQFRDYSSINVATLGEGVNADGDVDLLFGVGNNINSTANVSLYEGSNDYKFSAQMGINKRDRYVALTSVATENGLNVYTWLKSLNRVENVDGKDVTVNPALVKDLTDEEILASLPEEDLNITVTVHGDENKVTVINKSTDTIELPEITVPEGYHFGGYATSATGKVVLEVGLNETFTYDDIKHLIEEGSDMLDLYPVFIANPVVEEDLVVYIQVNGSYLTEQEAKLVEARFRSELTTENVKFNILNAKADDFKAEIETNADADLIIGGNNPLNTFTAHEEGALVNVGLKHFANTSRKVLINSSCPSEHLELAKKLYNFLVEDASEFVVHISFWPKSDYSWVSEEELLNIKSLIEGNLNSYLGIAEEETLSEKYNVTLTFEEVIVEGNKVADLGVATRALREGKGTDMIVGCGNNVDSETGAGMSIVAKKDIPTSLVAASRKVALLSDNCLTRNIYDVLFTE